MECPTGQDSRSWFTAQVLTIREMSAATNGESCEW